MKGTSSMRCRLLAPAVILAGGVVVGAQAPSYNLGRTPTEHELRPADAEISPNGDGLPPGSGTAKQGALVYGVRGCAGCHGPTGMEGPAPRLVGPPARAVTYGEHRGMETLTWPGFGIPNMPFAPMLWSWINKAMPLNQQGYLTPDEVYSLTAYLLHRNGIIQEDDVMDAKSLPPVRMPNREAYVPPPFSEWRPGMLRLFPYARPE